MPNMYCELHVHIHFVENRTLVSFITHVNLRQFIRPSDNTPSSVCVMVQLDVRYGRNMNVG